MKTLLIATNNAGKAREIKAILAPFYGEVATLKDAGIVLEVEEDGDTFAANAYKKAAEAAAVSGMDALADDSGLCIDALAGAPGVYSARFAGAHGDDAANNALVLDKLAGVPNAQRGAHFACAIALVRPDGSGVQVEGAVQGRILQAPLGENGFGYDPLFWYEQDGCSFAQMDSVRKNQISHRAVALKQLVKALEA